MNSWSRSLHSPTQTRRMQMVVIVLLAAMSNSALAEWIEVGSDNSATIYVDTTNLERTGTDAKAPSQTPRAPVIVNIAKRVKLWSLKNYSTPQVLSANGNPVPTAKKLALNSALEQYLIECKSGQYQLLAVSYHSRKDGNGTEIFKDSYPDAAWNPIPPDSPMESIWKFACEIKSPKEK